MRHVGALLTATALVLALGGCTDEPDDIVRTSGALADGFEIEPGSGLVGAVFPLGYGGGHQAVLRVDGDARRVLDGYVQQAEDLGFSFEPDGSGPEAGRCSDPDDDITYDDPPEPFQVYCSASGVRPPGDWDRVVSFGAFVEPDGKGYLGFTSEDYYSDAPALDPLTTDDEAARVTDDELAAELASQTDDPPVRLVAGSALALDPLGPCRGCGSYTAVLRVTDDLVPVMRGYLEQVTRAGFTSEGLVGDVDRPRFVAGTAGGGDFTAVGIAGNPSYVLIHRVYD